MSPFDLILNHIKHSTYVKKLIGQRTEELRQELLKKEEFIRTWSHDIGIPIHGMKAALGLLKDVQDSQDLLYVLDVLNKGCQILEDIKFNIQDFSNGHEDEPHFENVELEKWLPPVLELYRVLAKDKSIEIDLNTSNDGLVTITSDKLKLTRVVCNLLGNAIKFTPVGKSIFVRTYNRRTHFYIEIQDQGIGIPQDRLKDIFLPYVRLNERVPGMGIGLSICQKIMKQLQGLITVNSTVSKGSTFTIIIPLSIIGERDAGKIIHESKQQ